MSDRHYNRFLRRDIKCRMGYLDIPDISVEKCPSWVDGIWPAGQDFLRLSWNPKQYHQEFVSIWESEWLWISRPTSKLKDHPFLAVCDCLFNFSACSSRLAIQPPSEDWELAMTRWQGKKMVEMQADAPQIQFCNSYHWLLLHLNVIFEVYGRLSNTIY